MEVSMPVCDVCGNDYQLAFEVIAADGTHYVFDSLECAIHRIAPACAHCGCRIVGHGIEPTRAGSVVRTALGRPEWKGWWITRLKPAVSTG
jgi:hypothetical protein